MIYQLIVSQSASLPIQSVSNCLFICLETLVRPVSCELSLDTLRIITTWLLTHLHASSVVYVVRHRSSGLFLTSEYCVCYLLDFLIPNGCVRLSLPCNLSVCRLCDSEQSNLRWNNCAHSLCKEINSVPWAMEFCTSDDDCESMNKSLTFHSTKGLCPFDFPSLSRFRSAFPEQNQNTILNGSTLLTIGSIHTNWQWKLDKERNR